MAYHGKAIYMATTIMIVQSRQRYSVADYLAFEEQCAYKNEYRDEEIIPMTGASINHNRLVRNFGQILNLGLTGQNLEVFCNDLRLFVPRYQSYTYPDIMVIAGEAVFDGKRNDTVMNPILIVEVLSKSTADYDKGQKFDAYRSISELQEYILVDQYEMRIFQHNKLADDQWLLTEYRANTMLFKLVSIDIVVILLDIYDRVDFGIDKIS